MRIALRHVDWQLVLPVVILASISLTILFTIQPSYFFSQLIYYIISAAVFLFVTNITFSHLEDFRVPIYIASIILLLLLFVLGIESRGAVRWLDVLGFRIQFSEILKPFLLIALSGFLAKNQRPTISLFGKTCLLLFPIAFLIFKQPDLGTALIYTFTTFITMLFFGFSWWLYILGLLGVGIIIPFLFRFLHGYQKTRILTFLHLTNDPLGSSYNAIQAVIAVGSGLFFGKGLGLGTHSALKFLPERNTDFIFATLSEDLGFVGGVIVIVACIFLLRRIYMIYRETDEVFVKLFLIGSFSLLLVQCFINIGMNIGILPIVGV